MKKLKNTLKIILALLLSALALSGCLPIYGIEEPADYNLVPVKSAGFYSASALQKDKAEAASQDAEAPVTTVGEPEVTETITETAVSEPVAPETTIMEADAPVTVIEETTGYETEIAETTPDAVTDAPETTVMEADAPVTVIEETTGYETVAPETTFEETDAFTNVTEETTAQETTVTEETAVGESVVEKTVAPETKAEPAVEKTVVNQTVYATTNVWLRSDWSDNPVKYTVLSKDASITRTAIYENGWSGVSYNGNEVFIKSQYLTTAKPVATAASSNATNWEYSRDGLSIKIEKVKTSSKTYFVARVYTENPGVDIATMFSGSGNTYSSCFSSKEVCSTLAKKANAIFAINGDAVGFRPKTFRNNIVIRNGKLWYEGSKGIGSNLAMQSDGTLFVFNDNKYTTQQLMDMDVINTWWFDDVPLVINGEVISALRNGNDEYLQPRTAIGQVDKNNFIFIVCDGRGSNGSEGIGYKGMARLMKDLGATTAYILDGGGSSTMYFNGQVINRPCNSGGAERGLSDIIYVRK